jgi:hypothetical protein
MGVSISRNPDELANNVNGVLEGAVFLRILVLFALFYFMLRET